MFSCEITITSPDGQTSLDINATVDTTTGFSVFPVDLLHQLSIEPARKSLFEMDDGRTLEMDIGHALVTMDGSDWHSPLVFGPAGSQPRIGRVTLNIFQLAVDPDGSKLVHKPAHLPQGPRREVRSSPTQR